MEVLSCDRSFDTVSSKQYKLYYRQLSECSVKTEVTTDSLES